MDIIEALPGDDPRRLEGLLRDATVSGDRHADPAHVVVIGGDDAAEGDLVTRSSGREDVAQLSARQARHRLHISYMHGVGLLSQAGATRGCQDSHTRAWTQGLSQCRASAKPGARLVHGEVVRGEARVAVIGSVTSRIACDDSFSGPTSHLEVASPHGHPTMRVACVSRVAHGTSRAPSGPTTDS